MTNTSATGGYISPSSGLVASPLEDAAFDDFLQAIVVGITGIAQVFPRWQVTPPNLPTMGTDWASIGVTEQRADSFAYVQHNPVLDPVGVPPITPTPPPDGYDMLITHEIVEVLCSFYGPNCRGNASLLRDGLSMAQNREQMQLNRIAFVGCGAIVRVPSLVNTQWYDRADLPFTLRREIVRSYPILNILSVPVTLESEKVTITRIIQP